MLITTLRSCQTPITGSFSKQPPLLHLTTHFRHHAQHSVCPFYNNPCLHYLPCTNTNLRLLTTPCYCSQASYPLAITPCCYYPAVYRAALPCACTYLPAQKKKPQHALRFLWYQLLRVVFAFASISTIIFATGHIVV